MVIVYMIGDHAQPADDDNDDDDDDDDEDDVDDDDDENDDDDDDEPNRLKLENKNLGDRRQPKLCQEDFTNVPN